MGDHLCPGQRFRFILEEVGEWSSDRTVVLDETFVKAEEILVLFYGVRNEPGFGGYHLPFIHPNTLSTDVIKQNLN